MSRPSTPALHDLARADVHVKTAPLYDPANYPGSNEGLSVELPVSIATTDPSGQVVPAVIYASFPVEIPEEPIRAHLDQRIEVPNLPTLTSASSLAASGRAQTPAPRISHIEITEAVGNGDAKHVSGVQPAAYQLTS